MPINNQTYLTLMNLRFRFAYFALSALPVSAGDDVISSAKGGLPVSGNGDFLSSAKGGLDSLPVGDVSAKGVIDLAQPSPRSSTRWKLGWGLSWRKIG
ncbi:MAG: hypothetical protein ACJA1W_002689, partial [Akkermansiaceae bacterium]